MRAVVWVTAAWLALASTACEEIPVAPADEADLQSQPAEALVQETPPFPFAGPRILALREQLELTPEQVAEIEGILAGLQSASAPILEALRPRESDGTGPRGRRGWDAENADALGELRELRETAAARIGDVLTDEQNQLLDDLAPRGAGARFDGSRGAGARFDGPRGPGADRPFGSPRPGIERILRLQDELGLSADQAAALESILEELRARNEPLIEQLRSEVEELRGEIGPGGPPFGGRRGPFRPDSPAAEELRRNTEAALTEARGVLTDAQLELFRSLQEERPFQPRRRPSGAPRSFDARP